MESVRHGSGNWLLILSGILIFYLALAGCAGATVDVIRLTAEKFPEKTSADEVEVLEQAPGRPHIEIAELTIGDSGTSVARLQRKILKKAASLGADAVVFSKPHSQVEQGVTYQPLYDPLYNPFWYGSGGWGSPWGMGWGSPWGGYGNPWGMGFGGYGGSVAVPYETTLISLKGIAIRYADAQKS
ncbi:MAG TPA: hypothetical protein VJM82_08040 [Nitrospiraceae bacterium]|nr:hypothetical protein [Nitrospiraceae bacterium]